MLAHDIRQDVDKAWDTVWSAGVTNPIVVSDLIGTLLMAGASSDSWDRLRLAVEQGAAEQIARELAAVRRAYGVDPGSEIEDPEFWAVDHALQRTMDLIGPVIAAHGDVLGDIYEHILWDREPFVSFAAACPDLYDRTITVNGVSKCYAMSGWRIGCSVGVTRPIRWGRWPAPGLGRCRC